MLYKNYVIIKAQTLILNKRKNLEVVDGFSRFFTFLSLSAMG